jgi:Skp family chaperone for outer membrane proteins
MNYYRKTAAVFIIIMTLILPIFLEKEEFTGVVEVNKVYEESRYINNLIDKKLDSADNLSEEERKALEEEVIALIKEAAEEAAKQKNYTAVIFKKPLYRGGEDITGTIIEYIDQNYN